jgi:protein-S-isoprenylcysteine O-methyltransferase Ste14
VFEHLFEEELLFRLGLAKVFFGLCVVMVPARLRAHRAGGAVSRRGEGAFLMVALRVAGLALWTVAALFAIEPQWMAWSAMPVPMWARVGGLAIALAAVPMLAWTMHALGLNLTDTVAVRERATLVTHGPYRWIRHPMDVVVFLLALGLSLATANATVAIAGLGAIALLALRTPIEEAALVERHGDAYRAYMSRVGRYWPRLERGAARAKEAR